MKHSKIGLVLLCGLLFGTAVSCKKTGTEGDYPREFEGEVVNEKELPDGNIGNKPDSLAPEIDSAAIGSPAGDNNM